MKSRYLTGLALFIFCLPASPRPRQGASSQASRITLDVIVNDKSGRPVSGLQQRDFTIFDNKQPQQILSFEAAGGSAASDPLRTILVIDAVNIGFSRVSYAREQMEKFLREDNGKLVRPLSIDILTDSGLNLQSTPSSDGNALIAYMKQHQTGLRTISRSQGFYGAADRAQLSIRALEQLAEYEEKLPGRKIVIWLSPGWPMLSGPNVQLSKKDQESIFNSVVALSTELRQARIALYAVDPLGTADAGSTRTFYYEQFLKGVTAPSHVLFGDLGLQVLASQSGGRVLNSSNDVAGEIERCMRDGNTYYVLSYDASPADGPNEYHAIEVKVDQPQLKAQTRSGYYAQPTRPNMQ